MRKIILTILSCFFYGFIFSQELKATVNLVTNQVGTNVSKNTFQTLKTSLVNFLNNRKWSSETYTQNERIECSFLLTIEPTEEINVYSASLTIQSARPVYNSSYLSPIINFKDDKIKFKYQEFQQLDFNENRVAGNDALASNLTAVFAYYAYMIIGFDASSFSKNGGEIYFQKAQNIVNNAPDGNDISGWRAFDGVRNRYWLVGNVLNARYSVFNQIYYNYYRLVMDKMYEDEKSARQELINVLEQIETFNTDNPNTMINQFFFQGKSNEIVKILSKATPPEKAKCIEILSKVDVTNLRKYKDELK
jgi:hypothetical protein